MVARLRCVMLLAALPPALLLPAHPDNAEATTTPTAQQLYDALPHAEREPFLAYELALGLEQAASRDASLSGAAAAEALSRFAPQAGQLHAHSGSLADRLHQLYGIPSDLLLKFQNLPTPRDFDTNMYAWVKTSTNPTFAQMLQLAATGQYCVGSKCYSLQEPWGNCCPF